MATAPDWNNVEIKTLRQHWGLPPAELRARLPGRTMSAIYQKGQKLGLTASRGTYGQYAHTTTPAIDAAIRRLYEQPPRKGAVSELAEKLDRPRWWISTRARQLGLTAPRFADPPWTDAELDLLGDTAHLCVKSAAKRFRDAGYRRSETAIQVKRKRQACRPSDNGYYTATQLAQLFGVAGKTPALWIRNGQLTAHRRGTARADIQGGDHWWINARDVRRFVADNAHAVDLRKVDKHWFIDLMAGRN